MQTLPESVALPLKTDEYGAIRVSNTRVTLDSILALYHQGESPESIHDSFDVIPLNDVYVVIAYYLANKDSLDTYLAQRTAEGERLRQEWEARYTPAQHARTEEFKRLAAQKRNQKSE